MSRLDELRSELLRLDGTVVSFDPRSASALSGIIADIALGKSVADVRLRALQRRAESQIASQPGQLIRDPRASGKCIAVVSMCGVALYDYEYPPYAFSTLKLARTLTELASDSSVSAIVLDINTPGGSVTGTQEAADAVWAARKKKPVIGIINPLCASAGYWIGAQCTKLIAVPSADVGSIGVFMTHYDLSGAYAGAGIKPTLIYSGRYKTEGNPFQPLSTSAKDFYQDEINKTYRDFVGAVARGRNTSIGIVESKFGSGRVFGASDAQRVGMVDGIVPLPEAVLNLVASGSLPRARASAAYRAIIEDETHRNKSPAAAVRERIAILARDPR